MTKKSRNRFFFLVGAVVGLGLIGGNLGVKALERLMIYYPLNDHDFATPEVRLSRRISIGRVMMG